MNLFFISFPNYPLVYLKDAVFSSFTKRQQQIVLIASVILGAVVIAYAVNYYFKAKDVAKLELHDSDEFGVVNGIGQRILAYGSAKEGKKIVMQGNFIGGELNGKGEKKCLNVFEENGNYKNNLLHGHGEEIYSDGTRLIGEYRKGRLHGEGEIISPKGLNQKGIFREGCLIQGHRKCTNGDEEEGAFDNGFLNGEGKRICANGKIEDGLFENGTLIKARKVQLEDKYGRLNGEGERRYPDATYYAKGEFFNGNLVGKGIIELPNGEIRTGLFEKHSLVKGTITCRNGLTLNGYFENNVLHGEGEKTWKNADGETVFNGFFQKGRLNGKGFKNFPSGYREEGIFEDDILIKGTITYPVQTEQLKKSIGKPDD